MMEAIEGFVVDNFVLVIVGAIIFVIIADEVLGLTRAVFGDDDDGLGERPEMRSDRSFGAPDDAPADEPDDGGEDAPDDGTPTVDDLLDPPSRE